MKMFAASKS